MVSQIESCDCYNFLDLIDNGVFLRAKVIPFCIYSPFAVCWTESCPLNAQNFPTPVDGERD